MLTPTFTCNNVTPKDRFRGKFCMKGRIYTEEKCPICGGSFFHDERRAGLFCKKHPKTRASSKFIVRFGRDVTKRFSSFREAEQFLAGLRFKTIEGSFDARDYKKDHPLGFESLARKWLSVKKQGVKPGSYKNLRNYIHRAMKEWGQANIKDLGYGDLEDFLYKQKVSDKTRANIRSCLHDFWSWLRKRRIVITQQMPEFPEISFELGLRKIIDKETQEAVVDEVYRLTHHINPKVWIGIKWLCTYIAIRPGELLSLKEEDIDILLGYFIVRSPKEKKPKLVPIIEEDIELLKGLPRGMPHLAFFRHGRGISGVKAGEPFGKKYLYKWWKKACANLGVEGVDLYGGTRHSTTTALRQVATPEQIRNATFHHTNKAFERYYRVEADELRKIYLKANQLTKARSSEQHPNNQGKGKKKGKLLKLQPENGGGGGSRTLPLAC
jgi:integrase